MEERKKRFEEALHYAKQNGLIKTQQELADMMGSNKSTVSAAKSGNPEYLTDSFLVRFNKVMGDVFYLPWLLSGDGSMLKDDMQQSGGAMVYVVPLSSVGGTLQNMSVDGIGLADCETMVTPVNNAQFAIGVYGDSMAPTFPSGCRVFIRKIDPTAFISWGSVFVLDTVNGIYIKEVRRGHDDDHVLCVSHNQSGGYQPFEVALNDIYGMYRVLASVSVTQ